MKYHEIVEEERFFVAVKYRRTKGYVGVFFQRNLFGIIIIY